MPEWEGFLSKFETITFMHFRESFSWEGLFWEGSLERRVSRFSLNLRGLKRFTWSVREGSEVVEPTEKVGWGSEELSRVGGMVGDGGYGGGHRGVCFMSAAGGCEMGQGGPAVG